MKTVKELREAIENEKAGSAWDKGVKEYALELLEEMDEGKEMYGSPADRKECEKMKRLTRQQAIRAKCLDCCCGQANEVRLCPRTKCALYRYRTGRETTAECNDTAGGGGVEKIVLRYLNPEKEAHCEQ